MQGKSTHTHLKVEPCEAGRCALCSDVKGHVATDRTTADDVRVLHVSQLCILVPQQTSEEGKVTVPIERRSLMRRMADLPVALVVRCCRWRRKTTLIGSGNVENVNNRKARLKKKLQCREVAGVRFQTASFPWQSDGGTTGGAMGKKEGNRLEEVSEPSATSAGLRHAERRRSLIGGCVARSGCVRCSGWYERFPPSCA